MDENEEGLINTLEAAEQVGHKINLLVSIATSGQPLNQRALLGLIDYGVEILQDFKVLELKLRCYKEQCRPI